MAEYIEREAVLSAIWKTSAEHNLFFPAIILDAIKAIPAADVRPVKRGRWEYNQGDNIPYCSECMMPQDSEFQLLPKLRS